jgi:hypothetical protein
MDNETCQLRELPNISQQLDPFSIAWQRIMKLRVSFRRRVEYMMNALQRGMKRTKRMPTILRVNDLAAGDVVRVRSIEEIRSTLDNWSKLKGCTFLHEMEPFCGTIQKVRKRVSRFLNETDYLVKKCNRIVILENVFCEGTKNFGPCDRLCFFFWREEWLEKLAPLPGNDKKDQNVTVIKHP